ncbi:RING finger domain protein [Aspergillus sclerotialis]|uniref:RING finger domain protein n=1 Tax=Aspergillus sclerotialis TaxID=2070753 RepID=A0A3A2ZKZ7_9EURO|nr:RING finger domain protein [Aspergillus sclerotialis]
MASGTASAPSLTLAVRSFPESGTLVSILVTGTATLKLIKVEATSTTTATADGQTKLSSSTDHANLMSIIWGTVTGLVFIGIIVSVILKSRASPSAGAGATTGASTGAGAGEVTELRETVVPADIIQQMPRYTYPEQPGSLRTDCAICCDDFIPKITQIRELPCGHIFHMHCVDPYLTHHGDRCPLCNFCVRPNEGPSSHLDV